MKNRLSLIIFIFIVYVLARSAAKTPILIIPGFTGSQLQGTVSGGPCAASTPRMLWVDVSNFSCSIELELDYDASTNRYSDKQGVTVSVRGFGTSQGVECKSISKSFCEKNTTFQYFNKFVDFFVVNYGYQRDVDIRAAPYDWRLAADSLERQGYFDRLRNLTEEMYGDSGEPVAMVAHSMGGPMSLYFFNQVVNTGWKKKYIRAYIPISGAFAGASKVLENVASGAFPYGFLTRSLRRSFEGLYWLMPRPDTYKGLNLIETPSGKYTADDYETIFTKLAKYPLGWTKYKPTASISTNFSFPGVPTFCFVGRDVSTPLTYEFKSDDLSDAPTIIIVNGDGDGTVNKISLDVCLRWSNSSIFHYKAFSAVTHDQMVRDDSVFKAVANIVL